MLKCTEEDHPDHYQLQLSLHKLAAFLTQLNESIQYSMKLVSQVAQSPKLKRYYLSNNLNLFLTNQ